MSKNNDYGYAKRWLHNKITAVVIEGQKEIVKLMAQNENALHLWIQPSTALQAGDVVLSATKPKNNAGGEWVLCEKDCVNISTPYDAWHTIIHNKLRTAPILPM